MFRFCVKTFVGKVVLSSLLLVGMVFGTSHMGLAATETETAQAGNAQEAAVASVTGFRSATFGMDEDAVISAIATDFGVKKADINVSENTVERTKLMTVMVPDLLEGGGIAQVSYIFGYKSKTLIQVGASWNKGTDPEMTDVKLVANGDVLSNHFLSDGFSPDTVTVGTAVENGILLFRGVDLEGRAAILLLQGKFEETTEGRNALKPTGLALLYSVEPDAPDIFRIKDGNF
jgi:hypothetical protein